MKERVATRLAGAWLLLWFGAALVSRLALRTSDELDLVRNLGGPELAHWLGLDPFGRDLLAILLRASLTSAAFAALVTAISCVLALGFGITFAMAPRTLRFLGLRALDWFLAFPSLLIALAFAAFRGPGWGTLLGCLLIGVLPPFTRLLYARSRELVEEPYVLAAWSLGAGPFRVMRRHLAPQLRSLCATKVPFLFSQALMAEATLTFLGVGAPVGQPTWGALLLSGKEYLFEAPHVAIAAGIPLVLTILSLQVLAERMSQLRRKPSPEAGGS